MSSPLFLGTQPASSARMIRCKYEKRVQAIGCAPIPEDAAKVLTIVQDDIHLRECVAVNSLEEAEDIYVGAAAHLPAVGYPLCMRIARASNVIASRSRRSFGNVALVHPSALDVLHHETHGAFTPANVQNREGRWTHIGAVYGTTIWAAAHMPRDKAVVTMVNGVTDAGGSLLIDSQGAMHLYLIQTKPDYLGTFADYAVALT